MSEHKTTDIAVSMEGYLKRFVFYEVMTNGRTKGPEEIQSLKVKDENKKNVIVKIETKQGNEYKIEFPSENPISFTFTDNSITYETANYKNETVTHKFSII